MSFVSQEPQDSEFKVSDRRRFSAEGEPLDSSSGQDAEPADIDGDAAESAPPETARREQAAPDPSPEQTHAALPQASFDLLVMSLGMQAQMELGGFGDAENRPPNLDVARHTIDLLGVLREKTKGNLTLEESRLLENTLTELRYRYVQRVQEVNQQAKA